MCGRYALTLRPSTARQRLVDQHMPVDESPNDDEDLRLRQTYNFAPGYHGLIYRAVSLPHTEQQAGDEDDVSKNNKEGNTNKTGDGTARDVKFKLQSAKWGLIPFWTKRAPDYSSQLRTINCRDDSLIEDRGMWNTMKKRKRCIVIAEGFYEWLKKNDGKEKLPHFIKRSDGAIMCFAGLWDMVQYEGSDEKLYTYTIITTDSNQQLKFLHDRMPVMLEPDSEAMKLWLNPDVVEWNKSLQQLLKPFQGKLDCYPVDKAVGKVGNNSPTFVIPIDSKENKNNIANFFGKQKKQSAVGKEKDGLATSTKVESEESNAPLPKPKGESDETLETLVKEEPHDGKEEMRAIEHSRKRNREGLVPEESGQEKQKESGSPPPKALKKEAYSPVKTDDTKSSNARRLRSSTSNTQHTKSPSKTYGNAKITSFFAGGN